MPGQNISTWTPVSIKGLTAPVAGSYTDIRVLLGVSPMSVSKPSGSLDDHTRIFPEGSIAAATGIVGIWTVALHEPIPAIGPPSMVSRTQAKTFFSRFQRIDG